MHTRIRRTLGLLAVFAVVASLLLPATVTAAGPGSGGETSIGNNLSYPNIWSDGAPLALRGTAGTPQFGTPCATIGGQAIYCQQDPNSTWQADNEVATAPVDVSSIDWGDNLEARPWAAGSQVRVETTLYETLTTPMNGYNMVVVSGARSTEMQGTNGSTYESPTATIFSRAARLTIQPITSGDTLFWNPTTTQWTGAGVGAPLYNMAVFQAGDGPGQYTGEINVSGKVVYGYNWKTPAVAGTYRVTFSLDKQGFELANLGSTLKTYITDATTILPGEADAKGGVAQVDGTNNLSYIDVTLTPPRGGGGGGGETTIGNNLSYPAIWSDGDPLALRGTELEAVLNGAYTTVGDTNWYHQQDADNTWQAENEVATAPVNVSQIDWGDNLEARAWAAGQQVRVETTLFEDLTTPMQAYNMLVLSGTGASEMQGTDGNTFDSNQAIIFSRAARLTIQQITPDGTLTWDPSAGKWTGSVVGDPLYNMAVFEAGDGPGQYTGEINVGGKVVYGYNWKTPAVPGTYRITFSLDGVNYPGTLNTHITNATSIMPSDETDATGGVAQIDGTDNLSYIDVTLTNPNGGGGTGGGVQVESVSAPTAVEQGGTEAISGVVQNTGTESVTATVTLNEAPGGYTATQQVTIPAGSSVTVTFNWPTSTDTATGSHTFTVTATTTDDPESGSSSAQATTQVEQHAPPGSTCPNPTPVVQGMTAAVINPTQPVTGTIDATGCDIGVYFGPGTSGTVRNAEIFGAAAFGIFNDGARVDVKNSRIHDIGNGQDVCGSGDFAAAVGGDDECGGGDRRYIGGRSGTGILVLGVDRPARSTLVGNTISRYGRRGISVSGPGANVQITANTLTGGRPDGSSQGGPFQTGIWVANGASATISGNTITNHISAGGEGSAWVGIMVAGGADHNGMPNYTTRVQISGNTLRNNDVGVLLSNIPVDPAVQTENRVTGNTIQGPLTSATSTGQSGGEPRRAGIKVLGGVSDKVTGNSISGYATPIYVAPECSGVTAR
ncbi:MAG TPA: right-handed parallel beta-helix repeat-containing protein [Thermomicrobiaceae bacterium]|nr:right-handed parallel beta-helix repeat-containing protein [Thermomicrobiaceae bacterium]